MFGGNQTDSYVSKNVNVIVIGLTVRSIKRLAKCN
jgi:hypothetical protein